MAHTHAHAHARTHTHTHARTHINWKGDILPTQWPQKKGHKDKQRSTKHTLKIADR